MTGTVVLLSTANPRHSAVVQCFLALERPEGTRVEWFAGNVDVPKNRNIIAADFTGDWLLMIDDDQIFTPDLLVGLLRHLDDDVVDIVVPLILRKDPPYKPVIAAAVGEHFHPYILTTQRGLQPVDGAGTGVMLIRRRVFERVPPPWFERKGTIGNDLYFCRKAREAGCGIFCDFDMVVGHVMPMAIWPIRLPDGHWGNAFVTVPLGTTEATIHGVRLTAREAAKSGSAEGIYRGEQT